MMQLVPEQIDGVVVFNATEVCPFDETECSLCSDFAVGVHNWLVNYNLAYVIVDLQDEKEVCPEFLVELLQLKKRLKYPFYFAGVMAKARKVLESFGSSVSGSIFVTPEEAVAELKAKSPNLLATPLEGVPFGQPVPVSKPRQGLRIPGMVGGEEGAEDGEQSDMDEN